MEELLNRVLEYLGDVAGELRFISTEEEADDLAVEIRDRMAEFELMKSALEMGVAGD